MKAKLLVDIGERWPKGTIVELLGKRFYKVDGDGNLDFDFVYEKPEWEIIDDRVDDRLDSVDGGFDDR